ncbi:MAG: ABC transporter substrate-binding protein [Candidatus Kariarchaeaceae archaeon]|jgi:ABC-type branched-subunit amino acid transport system substrate-binding protein
MKKQLIMLILTVSLSLNVGYTVAAPVQVHQAPATLTLGGLFPLTGTLSGGGVEREAAARMAVNEINSRADILPQTELKITMRNTETLPATGATAAQELIDLGVFGLVGAASSSVSKAVADVAAPEQVPQISYSSTNADLTNKTAYPYFLRVVPPDSVQGVALANILYNDLGIKTVSTLATSDDYGTGGITVFTTAYTGLGGVVDVAQTFTQGSADVSTQLSAIAAGTARTVVLNVIVGDAKTVMGQAAAAGITPTGDATSWQWIGTDGSTQEAIFEGDTAVQAAMEDMIGTSLKKGEGPEWLRFKDMWECGDPTDYSGSGDRTPNTFASFAYDAVYAFAWAAHDMIVAGDDPTVGADLLAELKTADFDGATGRVTFDANSDRVAEYVLLNLKGDAFESVASWDPTNLYAQYGNLTFANGSTVQVLGPGDPNADPAGHKAQCGQFLFNVVEHTVTETDTTVNTATATDIVTVATTSVSTESPGFGLVLALMSMFIAIPILRRKN